MTTTMITTTNNNNNNNNKEYKNQRTANKQTTYASNPNYISTTIPSKCVGCLRLITYTLGVRSIPGLPANVP